MTDGTPWSDADWAAKGYGRINLRLPLETLIRLRRLAHQNATQPVQVIRKLIDAAYLGIDPESETK